MDLRLYFKNPSRQFAMSSEFLHNLGKRALKEQKFPLRFSLAKIKK